MLTAEGNCHEEAWLNIVKDHKEKIWKTRDILRNKHAVLNEGYTKSNPLTFLDYVWKQIK